MRGFARSAVVQQDAPATFVPSDGDGAAAGKSQLQKLDIVLAEDDPVSATLLRATLHRAGHNVRWVADVPSFFDILDQGNVRPDLIISDMNMPGGDPLDVLKSMRDKEKMSQLPSVPVVVLTGESGDGVLQSAFAAGADRVFQKPMEPERLLQEIRNLLIAELDRQGSR
jgi:CheY-like chemotaxis protein